MNRLIVAITITAIAGAVFATTDWTVHRFDDARFSVQLPEVPTRARQKLQADAPAAAATVFALKTREGSYMVSYVDSDTFDDDRNRIDNILDATARGAMTNAGASVIETRAITRNGFLGRAVQFRGRDGQVFRGLIFLAGERLYQVYALGDASWVNGKDADRFLNSFAMWK